MTIEVRKAALILQREGPLVLAARILRRAASAVAEHGDVRFFERDLTVEESEPRVTDFEVRLATRSDLARLLHGSDPLQSKAELVERFERGDLCFYAIDRRGFVVHTRWVSLGRASVAELGLDFVPGAGQAYFYNGYTRPDARRRGVDGLVRRHIFSALRRRGTARVFSYVRGDNEIGLIAARRWQREVGTVRYVRLGPLPPVVLGAKRGALRALLRRSDATGAEELAERERQWRAWFEGWLDQPLAQRSIGYHAVPEDGMRATADHLASTLELDSDDVVLEVGCSSALVTRWVAPRCRRLIGADYVAGLVADGRRDITREIENGSSCGAATFLTGDARRLPFPEATFTKAYCSGVVHTLPSRDDVVRVILELIRVCRPGARVMIAAVPDRAKHWRAVRAVWRQASVAGKLRLAVALALPRGARRLVKSMLRRRQRPRWESLVYLELDLARLRAELESRGLSCSVVDYPERYWSEDFRETRSNLLIEIPS